MKQDSLNCLFLFFFLLFIPGPGYSAEQVSFQKGVKTGTVFDPQLSEISGIFSSWKTRDVLWVVNDSGNPAELYAISSGGKFLNAFSVEGADNIDWEDMSGFRHNGKGYLIIGDIGDNKARRDFCTLYAVSEPNAAPSLTEQSLPIQWQMHFKYADGPRDCEALAVDETRQRIYLLSKRDKYPVLYELPLSFDPEDTLYTATPVARIRTIPQPTPADLKEKYGKHRSRPTSMDISSNGRTLVILTYKHGYLYRRHPGQTWDQAVESPPELLPLPDTGELVQREALCIDREKNNIIVTTEQIPAPIYTFTPRVTP